jgi:hypothetical protein
MTSSEEKLYKETFLRIEKLNDTVIKLNKEINENYSSI